MEQFCLSNLSSKNLGKIGQVRNRGLDVHLKLLRYVRSQFTKLCPLGGQGSLT
jgi:hypothetical protein